MPRIFINGLPKTRSGSHGVKIRINANPKGGGQRAHWLVDREVNQSSRFEWVLDKAFLNATVRVIVEAPGFIIWEQNIKLDKTHTALTPKLKKNDAFNAEQQAEYYGSTSQYQAIDPQRLYFEGQETINEARKAEQKLEMIAWAMACLVTFIVGGLFYILLGPVGLLLALFFGWLAKVRVAIVSPFSRLK